jgi:hypothetical protein
MAKKNKEKSIVMIFTVVFICFVGYIWYIVYNIVFTSVLNSQSEEILNEINNVKIDIQWIENNQNYKKLAMTKVIKTKESSIAWSDNIRKLILLFNTISEQSSELAWNIWWLELSDFNINWNNINFVWTISDIKIVYEDGWVIDQFANLDFIDAMEIPFYREEQINKKDTIIRFNLNAKIK